MKVEFMVEDNAYFNSDMSYKIVDSYDPEYPLHGYDIYQVETDKISNIRVVNGTTGIEYEAEQVVECMSGGETVYYVSSWKPVE